MLKTQNNVASFVLRFTQELWQDAEGEPRVQWRGHIRHVQGDEEDRFIDFAEAVTFIQRHLTQLTLGALSGDQTLDPLKMFKESLQIWDQFTTAYTGVAFDALEQTMKQTHVVKEQIDQATQRAFKTWHLPMQ